MGKAAKTKGSRTERELVNLLKEEGHDAKRIPGSGAYNFNYSGGNLKADVLVERRGQAGIKIECKSRKTEFRKIYELYAKLGDPCVTGILGSDGYSCITITGSFKVAAGEDFFCVEAPEGFSRTVRKIENMRKLLGEADILAIRGDREPWLFIKYHD